MKQYTQTQKIAVVDLCYDSYQRPLKEAKVKPEEHQDLVVRVGGFSAYFVQLSPQIQDDVIGRQEHSL